MHVLLNDKIINASEATLHISDLSIQRGYGIFDFFKVVDGHPYFLGDYLDRFYHSAAVMRMEVPLSRVRLTDRIYELTRLNNMAQSGIKMILTGGYSHDGYQPADPNLIISQHPLVLPAKPVIESGVRIITHEYVRDIPQVKTINYTMGIWLIEKISNAGAADVLYVKDNLVSEFPRSNFFIVTHDNRVLTAASNVLHGVTRKNILSLAAESFSAAETDITLDDVYNAREAFITSTTKRIIPVVQVNDRAIGSGKPGPVSLELLERLVQLEAEDRKKN